MNKETVVVNKEQAEGLLAEWQKTLKLQDWDIVIDIRREREMELEGGQAEVHWHKDKRMAIIHLLDPLDYSNQYWPQDHEMSLVHELLHIHMVGFAAEDGTPEDAAQEQAINAISFALVDLKRKSMPLKPSMAVVRGGTDDTEPEIQAS